MPKRPPPQGSITGRERGVASIGTANQRHSYVTHKRLDACSQLLPFLWIEVLLKLMQPTRLSARSWGLVLVDLVGAGRNLST